MGAARNEAMEGAQNADAGAALAAALVTERRRLVGLCARLTGNSAAAEDLAQETLVEAWRNRHKIWDPDGVAPWLSAIARNVCARWARTQGRNLVQDATYLDQSDICCLADSFDLEHELERDELARLLDRAMTYLPGETRTALVARYVEGTPQAQVAMRLGQTEGAVAMRLQRGKLALRQILANELRDEAAAYGLSGSGDDRWEDCRIWCPVCGQHRLRARLIRTTGELTVVCPGCTPTRDAHLSRATMPLLHRDTLTAKAGVSRLFDWMHRSFYGIAPSGMVHCQRCERLTPLHVAPIGWAHAPQLRYTVTTTCASCGHRDRMWLSGIVLGLPEGRRFWRQHRRVRLLPERTVEWEGRVVAVLGLGSIESSARLEVIAELTTLTVLNIKGGDESLPCREPD